MKKIRLLLTALTLTLVFAGSGLFTSEAKAAKKAVAAVVNGGECVVGYTGSWELITVNMTEQGDKVANVKTDSANAFAYVSNMYSSDDFTGENTQNSASIDLYARTEGTYTVSFDVVGEDGKVKESFSEKVTAKKKPDTAIKSVLVDGENLYSDDFDDITFFEKHATPTVKVALKKNYKLKKVEYAVAEKNTEDGKVESVYNYKKIKNGDKISFSSEPVVSGHISQYENSYGDDVNGGGYEFKSEYVSTYYYTCTRLKVTYTVKGSDEEKEEYVYLYRKADTNKVSKKAKTAKAASFDGNFVNKIHIGLNSHTVNLPIEHDAPGDYIDNLTSNSANCSVFISQRNSSYSREYTVEKSVYVKDETKSDNTVTTLGFYATKAGTYYITFDIYDRFGNLKVKNVKIVVYANKSTAVKSITYAGKDISGEEYSVPVDNLALKGKINIELNEGYTLKKIYYSYNKEKKTTDDFGTTSNYAVKYKAVSNGKKIALNTKPYFYELSQSSDGEYWMKYYSRTQNCFAYTCIRIVYTDKYTGLETQENFYIYTLVFDEVKQ